MDVQANSITEFQSTLPMRGATHLGKDHRGGGEFQSTLPMRGATCHKRRRVHSDTGISIHAPHEGSDLFPRRCVDSKGISIHAPHEGSDPL